MTDRRHVSGMTNDHDGYWSGEPSMQFTELKPVDPGDGTSAAVYHDEIPGEGRSH